MKQEIRLHSREMLPGSTIIRLTGNPFVDTGLAVIAARSKLDSVDQLTLAKLHAVHKDGKWLARDVHSLKNFTMIFTRNALLTQHPKGDKTKIERRIEMHSKITSELLNAIGNETENEYCESCGNPRSLNLSAAINHALQSFGEEPKQRFVGRDWFPLAGSLGSDAQALPSASKAVSLCAQCLFAVQYLPLGVRLFGNELVVFQSTSRDFWYSLARDIADEVQIRVADKNPEIIGSKEGRGGLVRQLFSTFRDLQRKRILLNLEEDTKLFAWRFANSTAPNIDIDSIPTFALQFLWKAAFEEDLKSEIESILKRERMQEDHKFFACLISRSEYYGLYPGKLGSQKDYPGASHELFRFYQTQVLGRSAGSLRAAWEIARNAIEFFESRIESKERHKTMSKELQRLTRKEAFREAKTKAIFRKIMVEQTIRGKFDLKTYLEIFPYAPEAGVSVSASGWDLLRYYVGKAGRGSPIGDESEDGPIQRTVSPTLKMVAFVAATIFQRHKKERGIERFRHDILERIARGRVDVNWFRTQYLHSARETDGFTYSTWRKLCWAENSRWTFPELLFQIRLLWSEWANRPLPALDVENPFEEVKSVEAMIRSSDLPENIARTLVTMLSNYIESRGIERAKKTIFARLQSGELGIWWLRNKIVETDRVQSTIDEMDEFMNGKSGDVLVSEKRFQLLLFVNNFYRWIANTKFIGAEGQKVRL